MTQHRQSHLELMPHLFRKEYAKMTAVLCRHFGLKCIEIAEDIASDTFLKASESWALHGVPDNPTAWLYTVAKNKAKDHFRYTSISEKKETADLRSNHVAIEFDFEFSSQTISDSQLAMIFAVCNPSNSVESQICLALQILCGFSVEEIANAFLTKIDTIKKRLHRARNNLRNDSFQIKTLTEKEIKQRQDTVLKTLYLLFNEGYFSKTNNQIIRKELCSEAVRLTLMLTENPLTNTSQTNALLALMCYQSSRLEARISANGEAILFAEQDKNLWDKSLIDRGNYYFINATHLNEISKYHLEAAIAYWHTTPADESKWQHILQLYNRLILIEYSPMTALNRAFVFAKVHGKQNAIYETQKLNLANNSYFHALLGFLFSESNQEKAISHYQTAIALTKSKIEKQTLTKEIIRLKEKKPCT